MGGHNRPFLNQRWVGVDGEQVFARDTRGPAGFSCLFGLFGLFG
jgi:hypothetical protein